MSKQSVDRQTCKLLKLLTAMQLLPSLPRLLEIKEVQSLKKQLLWLQKSWDEIMEIELSKSSAVMCLLKKSFTLNTHVWMVMDLYTKLPRLQSYVLLVKRQFKQARKSFPASKPALHPSVSIVLAVQKVTISSNSHASNSPEISQCVLKDVALNVKPI